MTDATTRAVDALSVEGVSHAYGARLALDKVSFALEPARFTALLGLNGAGKSTLFAVITRLYPIRTGRIRIFGHDATREPSAALRALGVVFQSRTLDLDLSVAQNLAYHAALHGIAAPQAARLAAEALAQIGLAERARDKVRALSGGQMRRGECIRARADILAHVRMLVRERGVAVVWATHLVDEVADDDALIVLHRGRVLADDAVARVIAQAGGATVRDAFTRLTDSSRDDAA
jgi:ABC-2 type transport system ATP-binding protein